MTSNPDNGIRNGGRLHVAVDELFRDVPAIQSVDELASADIFESDEELNEFLIAVRADREADLA